MALELHERHRTRSCLGPAIANEARVELGNFRRESKRRLQAEQQDQGLKYLDTRNEHLWIQETS